jgi:hypothetical protein
MVSEFNQDTVKSNTGSCIITCRFAFPKHCMLVFTCGWMWLTVTAPAGGLSDAFAAVIQAVRYQQRPFHPLGLVGAFGFREAALLTCETLTAQSSSSISLLSRNDFGLKRAENFESQKTVCTCKQVASLHITCLPESDQQTSVTFDRTGHGWLQQCLACLAVIPASCLYTVTGRRSVMKELKTFPFWYASVALRAGKYWMITEVIIDIPARYTGPLNSL